MRIIYVTGHHVDEKPTSLQTYKCGVLEFHELNHESDSTWHSDVDPNGKRVDRENELDNRDAQRMGVDFILEAEPLPGESNGDFVVTAVSDKPPTNYPADPPAVAAKME